MMQYKIERLFVNIVFYGVPIGVIAYLSLVVGGIISYERDIQTLCASRGFGLLVFLLFIKPLSIIPSKYFKAQSQTISDFFKFLFSGRTQEPILQYVWKLVLNGVFSLSNYLIKFRRQFGILTFWFIFLHFMLLEISRYQQDLSLRELNTMPRMITGLIGLLALFIGFVTSNARSVRMLKTYWKTVQRVAYIALIAGVVHLVINEREEEISTIILLFLYAILKFFERKKTPSVAILPSETKVKTEIKATTKQNFQKRICVVCGYIYDEAAGDPDGGLAPGTRYEDIPDNRTCPICGVSKKDFRLLEEKGKNTLQEPPKSNNKIRAKILNYQMVTEKVLELTIEANQEVKVIPGQRMGFPFEDEKGKFTRAYSMVDQDTDNEKTMLIFLIELLPEGRGAKKLRELHIGDTLEINPPAGNFILQNTSNPKVFIATGTGLAPIYNMIKHAESVQKILYFSASYAKDLFYIDKFEKIKNLKTIVHVTRENIPGYEYGRLDVSKHSFDAHTEFYVCGNPSITADIISKLEKQGIKQIFSEKF